MKCILELKEIRAVDTHLAGGKGASLGEMIQSGISVPDGFVILASAFEEFLKDTDLNVAVDAILDSVKHEQISTIEDASEKIQALILQAEIPQDIGEGVQKYFKKLNSQYVAVRSSATAEDSASAAWAGQLDSYLNTTEENLLENVKKCWASLFTPRAIFYRFEKDLHKQKISVAVVVQTMVNSEKSGIAFSVHPITLEENQLIIEAGLGLGEAIVSGQITPDSYVVEKQPRRIIDRNIRNQEKGLYRVEGGGNEWLDTSKEQRGKQILSDKEILELSNIICQIEKHYGFPCDIEWAYEAGGFYVVQSRPITTLEKPAIVNQVRYEKMEHMENIYPLDILSLEFGWGDLVKRKEYDVPAVEFVLDFHGSTATLYCDGNAYHLAARKILETFSSSPLLQKELKDRADIFIEEIQVLLREIKDKNYTSLREIHEKIQKVFYDNSFLFIEENITSLHSTILSEKLKELISDEEIPYVLYPEEISGFQRYDLELLELCTKFSGRQNISIRDLDAFRSEIDQLINNYGWITAGFNDKPKDIDQIIVEINDVLLSGKEPGDLLKERKEGREASVLQRSDTERKLRETLTKDEFAFIKVAQQLINQGQIRIEWLLKLVYSSRSVYEEIAKSTNIPIAQLKFLMPSEISSMLSGSHIATQEIIQQRENRFIISIKGSAVSFLDSFHVIADDDTDVLKGQTAFPGKVTGRVKIVNSSADLNKILEGDILVSSRTSPELVPAMQKAAAIISELGGLLCHAAIVSREMKKPCIVGVKNATSFLRDNDLVAVDASNGILQKIDL